METTRENYEEVRQVTIGYVHEQLDRYLADSDHVVGVSDETKIHVTDIGVSILETKWPEIGMYQGGSFVQAMVNNDLQQAFGTCDYINEQFIKFYLILMYNFSIYNLPYKNK